MVQGIIIHNYYCIMHFCLHRNLIEKSGILDLINLAISDQLALYGGMSGSKSPTMSSISAYGSPFRGRNHSFISQLTKTDSVDSEYELTLL